MKRELGFVLEVESQLACTLGENRSCMAAPSQIQTQGSCSSQVENFCQKKFNSMEVNGFIVYTRLKKSKSNGSAKCSQILVNGTVKSLECSIIDSTFLANSGKVHREISEVVDNVIVENDMLVDDVSRDKPNSAREESVFREDLVSLQIRPSVDEEHLEMRHANTGIVDTKKKVPVLRRFTRSASKNVVPMDGAHGGELSAVVEISKPMGSNADKDDTTGTPIKSRESAKPSKRFTRSALKAEEPVAATLCSLQAIGSETIPKRDVEMIADGSSSSYTPKKNLELKMSKKIALDRKPITVKELFETGLLEGVPVIYMGGRKAFGLRGTIKDVGILCSCSLCKGCRIIPPSKFEIHACNQYRRASQYICFENGKSLLDVLNACRASPLHALESTLQTATSSSDKDICFTCIKCKGSFPMTNVGKLGPLCIPCAYSKESGDDPIIATDSSKARSPGPRLISELPKCVTTLDSPCHTREKKRTRKNFIQDHHKVGSEVEIKEAQKNLEKDAKSLRSTKTSLAAVTRKSASVPKTTRVSSQWKTRTKSIKADICTRVAETCSLPAASRGKRQLKPAIKLSRTVVIPKLFEKASARVSEETKFLWKRTTKDQRLHKLVFDEGGLPDGTEVAYYGRGQKLLEGYKKGFGIFCRCCNSEVSPSQFEVHAGWASRKKPYSYIYLSNGVSLHELAVSLSKGRKYSSKDNDDICVICADGGNLVLCDGCPRAFHKECASLSCLPRGDWYCTYCENMFEREKFLAHNENAIAAGRVSGIDPIEQLTKRCIRIVESIEAELSGCCVICRRYDFSKSGFGPRTIILCDQCEKEYHVGCLKTHKIANLKELPKGKWFCCLDCSGIYSSLQKLLSFGDEKLPDCLLELLKNKQIEKSLETSAGIDVRWRLLSGTIASPETRPLLSQAVAIFHDCFDPIVDSASGRDLIPHMVYGRNLKGRLEYGGMYCAVLMVNSIVISAGVLRVFGQEVAELPLVATSSGNHGKGYFQVLFSCIEKLLGSLNVKTLVLPAAAEAESIWTDKFSFQKMKPDELSIYRRSWSQIVTFQGTSMLQKSVPSDISINNSTGFIGSLQ